MKNFLLLFLFFPSILVLVIGCGRTEDETQQRLEDLVGNWEFVSFGERSVDETINAFFDDTGVTGVAVDVTTNSLVFEQNGSWSKEIEGEFVGNLSNLIEAVTLSKATLNFAEQGTHFVSTSSLSLVPQSVNVSVEPQYFWELVGTTEEDFAQEFRSEVFGTIYAFSWRVEDDMLILTEVENGEKTVLKKK